MIRQRCVLDLLGYGRMFRLHLRQMGIRSEVDSNGVICESDLEFAYNELTCQIVMALNLNTQGFLIELQTLPDFRRLEHIRQFDPEHYQSLHSTEFFAKFQEYGMAIMHIISDTLTIQTDVEYLLETVAEDYIIVMRCSETKFS